MSETKVAKRYAKSLLDIGKENNIVDQLYDDVNLLLSTMKANRQLSVFFKSPIISTDKKDAVLKGLFEGKVNKLTLSFFNVITRKHREYFIEDIALSFVELYRIYRHQQIAWLTTAIPADTEIRKSMLDLIGKTTSDQIELREIVDPSIIGGFILRWGDHQLDTSVTHKLHALRQDFKDNLYQKDY